MNTLARKPTSLTWQRAAGLTDQARIKRIKRHDGAGALNEDTWHPHVYDFSQAEVTDQRGTANPMNELVAKESFNDVDRGVLVAPPV